MSVLDFSHGSGNPAKSQTFTRSEWFEMEYSKKMFSNFIELGDYRSLEVRSPKIEHITSKVKSLSPAGSSSSFSEAGGTSPTVLMPPCAATLTQVTSERENPY